MSPSRPCVLLVARPATGGLRAHIIELLRLIDRRTYEPWICGPRDFLDSLPQDLAPFRPELCPVKSRLSLSDPAAALRLLGLIRAAQSTGTALVHAHGLRAGWVASLASLARPFPLIITLHNIPAGGLRRVILKLLIRRASRLICVSEAIRQSVGEPADIIPNGVDIERYQLLDRDAARRALGLPAGAFVVGCIARLSSEKGVDVLLSAARLVPDMRFIVAGDGPERDRIAALAPENAALLGRQESIVPVLAAADAIAVPSRSEGQGIVALEALASKRPVAASNVGGLPEMIQDGITGLLVPPENPEQLAAALRRLEGDPELRARLAAAGYEYAVSHGSIRDRVAEVEAVYRAVLGRPEEG